jgi:hypothetical protein
VEITGVESSGVERNGKDVGTMPKKPVTYKIRLEVGLWDDEGLARSATSIVGERAATGDEETGELMDAVWMTAKEALEKWMDE